MSLNYDDTFDGSLRLVVVLCIIYWEVIMGLHRGFNEIEVNNGGGGMYGLLRRV